MRKITLSLLPLIFVACSEPDLTGENQNPDSENVYIASSFVYNQEQFYPDSMITNKEGLDFFITDVQLVLSDFAFIQNDDTVAITTEPFIISYGDFDKPLLILKPGGYSGHYNLRIGLDSLTSATITRSSLPPGNDLLDADVFRNDGNGVDNIVITGRLIDPTNPLDSIGTIPLEYRLGTYATSRLVTSLQQNFAIAADSDMRIIMQVDIGPILDEFDLELKPMVSTDISNPIDYNLALIMADSLQVGLF